MKKNKENRDLPVRQSSELMTHDFPGYPVYPTDEDIYNNYKEEKDINPENVTEKKVFNETDKKRQERGPGSGRDLDIPGSELDDKMEDIGSEDEENNFYSVGDDEHTDQDESKVG